MKTAYDGGVRADRYATTPVSMECVCGGGAAHLPRAQVNFFDNAEGYGSGDAEELMGQAITLGIERGYWVREDLVISECGHWGT